MLLVDFYEFRIDSPLFRYFSWNKVVCDISDEPVRERRDLLITIDSQVVDPIPPDILPSREILNHQKRMKGQQRERDPSHKQQSHSKKINPGLILLHLPRLPTHIDQHQQKLNKLHHQITPKDVSVPFPDAVVHPRTMVVEGQDAFLAFVAVSDSIRLEGLADSAVSVGGLCAAFL